jgi:hypothetical protein
MEGYRCIDRRLRKVACERYELQILDLTANQTEVVVHSKLLVEAELSLRCKGRDVKECYDMDKPTPLVR